LGTFSFEGKLKRELNMKPPEIFETKRLFLRVPKMSDAQRVFLYASDVETVRYLVFNKHDSVKEAETFLASCIENWKSGDSFSYAICLKMTGELIGMISIRDVPSFKPHFGYVLMKPYWGNGYVSEALSTLMSWAWAQPRIYRLWAFCDVDNPASARVMEKVGMTKEAVLKRWHMAPNISDEPRDCLVYAKTK
jgi:[ribosomal protein S5]-alanine N-acetyltransferase